MFPITTLWEVGRESELVTLVQAKRGILCSIYAVKGFPYQIRSVPFSPSLPGSHNTTVRYFDNVAPYSHPYIISVIACPQTPQTIHIPPLNRLSKDSPLLPSSA